MVDSVIDSASIYSVATLLRKTTLAATYPWEQRAAFIATTALVGATSLKMAPAPSVHGAAADLYGYLMDHCRTLIHLIDDDRESATYAREHMQRWGAQPNSTDKVRTAHEQTIANPSYLPWIQDCIDLGWNEHAQRLGGLFNEEYIPLLARVIGTADSELSTVLDLTREPRRLDQLRKLGKGPEFELAQQAYVISGILRGRYHELVAKHRGSQILHHPLREGPVLLELRQRPRKRYAVTNSEAYLSAIILMGAFTERGAKSRIACWADNVKRAKDYVATNEPDLRMKSTAERAIDNAADVARRAGVRTHPRWWEMVADMLAAAGVTALTSFILVGWEAAAVAVPAYMLGRTQGIGRTSVGLASERSDRLRRLAKGWPGRIEVEWKSL